MREVSVSKFGRTRHRAVDKQQVSASHSASERRSLTQVIARAALLTIPNQFSLVLTAIIVEFAQTKTSISGIRASSSPGAE